MDTVVSEESVNGPKSERLPIAMSSELGGLGRNLYTQAL